MTVLVSDSFNRANSTTTLGTTDSYNGGTTKTWTPFSGNTWGVWNNQVYAENGAEPLGVVVDAGQADISISVTIAIKADMFGCIFRVDTTNKSGLMFHAGNGQLQKFVGTTYTTIASSGKTIVAGDVIKVTANGSAITVYQNGTQILTTTSTYNQALTKHGFGNWRISDRANGNLNGAWDNFIVEDLATGGTAYTKSLSDSLATSETFAKLIHSYKTVTDAISSAETFTNRFTGYKSLADSVTSADSIKKQLSVAIIDTINTSESENEQSIKQLSDTINSADTLYKLLQKAINDSVGSSDGITQHGGNAANFSDYVTITDTIRKALVKYQSDSVTTGEVDSEKVTKQLLDSLTQSDSITSTKGKAVVLSDSILTADSLRKAIAKAQAESVGLSESVAKQSAVSVRLYDVLVTTDSLSTYLPNVPEYREVIRIPINISTTQTVFVAITQRQVVNVDISQRRKMDVDL